MPTKTELRAKIEALLREEGASFGSDALAGELVDVIERGGGLRLDPEPERPRLPRRVRLDDVDGSYLVAEFGGAPASLLPAPGEFFAHLDFAGDWNLSLEERRTIAEAVLAAYNREREEEAFEAESGPALDAGIEQLCRGAVAAEVERGVAGERARCLAIFDAFLSDLPAGWDFVRLRAKEARGKVESGCPPAETCEWPGCKAPALCRSGNGSLMVPVPVTAIREACRLMGIPIPEECRKGIEPD